MGSRTGGSRASPCVGRLVMTVERCFSLLSSSKMCAKRRELLKQCTGHRLSSEINLLMCSFRRRRAQNGKTATLAELRMAVMVAGAMVIRIPEVQETGKAIEFAMIVVVMTSVVAT